MKWLNFICKLHLGKAVVTKRTTGQCLTELRTKEPMEEETAAEQRGNQINMTQWVRVRVVHLTELDSSSYTNSGKTLNLSKPGFYRVVVRL